MPASTASALARSVIGFNVCLPGFNEALQAACPAEHIETRLIACLDRPVRLLRWAVVRIEERDGRPFFWCEGAYLTEAERIPSI